MATRDWTRSADYPHLILFKLTRYKLLIVGQVQLELQLFGRGLVKLENQTITLATRKALALLAYLVLEKNTTRGILANLLWSDLSQESARNNLRKELFRLRETPIAPYLEVTTTDVRLLRTKSDVEQFLALAAEANETALQYNQQLFLAGLELSGANEFEEWLLEKRETIQSHLTRLWATRAIRLEAIQDFRGALEARLALVHLDPLQEVHHRDAMRLHWQLGERAAALERFDTLERTLKTELGLKPLPESLELLERIEKAIPEITSHPTQPKQQPELSHPPLVGREDAWVWLENQEKNCICITGEIGIGKTRLCEEYTKAHGGYLRLTGYATAMTTPFYPIAQTLRMVLTQQRLKPEQMDMIWRTEIARLVPEYAEPLRENLSSSLDGRAKFIESLARALETAMRPQETLLLDDLHWFDPSSLELIAHLARNNTKMIITARELETSENPSAQNLIQALEREGRLCKYALPPLNETQTQTLLQTLSGRNAPLFAKRLQVASGGNPLLTLETLHGFFESNLLTLEPDGTWSSAIDTQTNDYTELPIPKNVRELVLGRIEHLGAAVKRILEVATLSAETFIAEDLLSATALSEWEAITALERAVAAQIFHRENTQYRFNHDVIRRSLYDQFTPERQNLIHRRLAQQLIRTSGNPARIANHLEQSGQPQEAIPYIVKAAQNARNVFAHQEARTMYTHALELNPQASLEFEIHANSADLELTLLNLDALEQHAQAMQDLSHALPLEYSVKASLLIAKAQLYRGQFANALETASQALGDSTGETRAETLLLIGTALAGSGSTTEAKDKLLEGLALQKRGVIAAELHSSLKEVYRRLGDLPAALEQSERAYGIYKALKIREQEITQLANVGQLLGLLGRTSESLNQLKIATAEARKWGLQGVLTVCLVLLCAEQLRAGFFTEAQAPIEEGLALTKGRMQARECQFTAMLSKVQFRTGQLGQALENAHKALELSRGLGVQQLIQRLWTIEVLTSIYLFKEAQEQVELAEKILDHATQEYWFLLQVFKLEIALGQQQLGKAQEYLQELEALFHSPRFEYQVKAACAFAHYYFLVNDLKKAVVFLDKLPSDLPNWLVLRIHSWYFILGITPETKKRVKIIGTSLENLGFLESMAHQATGKQQQILQKQIVEMRLNLEKTLENYPQWQQIIKSLPKFGTLLERRNN